ncbi:zinc finger protein 623-like [Anopheles maculipalpis]|uniref:zinc finger protein 623-like n=1 Tax=Anopheles maculipalpis TaxID=1496333 RepID=UPI002158B641|nr:zinc finger protein 623-like [Anopheles maculipalpis]
MLIAVLDENTFYCNQNKALVARMSGHDVAQDDEILVNDGTGLYSHCYLCHTPAVQDEFCHLFPEPEFFSPVKTICDVLDVALVPELCHSLIICKRCNTLCAEYQSLAERMEIIHRTITTTYNQTVMKLTGLTETDIKEGLVAVEYNDNIDPELHTFNKELMSMEDMFGELNPDEIQVDPSYQNLQDSASHLHSDVVSEDCIQFIKVDERVTPLLPTEPDEQQEKIVAQELTVEETIKRYIIEPDDTVVEVDEEDGTSIYCVYNDVMDSLSDTEEPPATEAVVLHDVLETHGMLENDDITIDNASQASEDGVNEIQESVSATSLLLKEAEISEADSSALTERDDVRPYYVKIENYYYCIVCPTNNDETTVSTNGIKQMADHLSKDHNILSHTCQLCDAIYFQREDYVNHLATHATEGKNSQASKLSCDQCDATFAKQSALDLHRKTHPSVKNKVWHCELCDKKYTSKAFFEVHMNKHAGLRPFKCTVCSKDFSSKYALAVHLKTHYERPRTFVCKECGNAFYSRHNLVQHERTHRAEREYECGDCGKKFFTQHNLNVHKVIHSNNKAFACPQCGKKFARKAEFRDHERTHTGEKPFVCDMCDLAFAQRSNLNSHKRLTHFNDKRYKCDICGACFKRRRLLDYHTRAMHTGERPYKCELCPASFVYPEHFQKHKRIHTGIKPYACEVCNKTFTSQDNRNAHRYVHSDKKPYECVTCGSGFMRKAQLYTHMQEQGHLNDTIVVNQPRISANDAIEFETESLVIDGQVDGEQNPDVEPISDDEHTQITFICDEEYVDGVSEME